MIKINAFFAFLFAFTLVVLSIGVSPHVLGQPATFPPTQVPVLNGTLRGKFSFANKSSSRPLNQKNVGFFWNAKIKINGPDTTQTKDEEIKPDDRLLWSKHGSLVCVDAQRQFYLYDPVSLESSYLRCFNSQGVEARRWEVPTSFLMSGAAVTRSGTV